MAVRLGIRKLFGPLLLITFSTALAACGGDGGDEPLIVASDAIPAEWARAVAGEGYRVEALVPPGGDAHTFSLSPDHLRLLREADVVVLMGAGLEAAFEDAVHENAGGPVLTLADHLELQPFPEALIDAAEHEDDGDDGEEEHAHGHGDLDPHFWLDADLAAEAVRLIAEELGRLFPEDADRFAANAEEYVRRLREADEQVRQALAELPPHRRYLVTFHDAYGYFARRYDLEILGFVVEGPEEEPSAARVAELVREIRERGIDRIYREPQWSARVLEQIARETGAEVRDLPSHLTPEHDTLPELLLAMAEAISAP